MAFVTIPRPPRPKRSPIPGQILIALVGGLCLFLLLVGIITGSYQLLFNGRIFPGISMAGVDLSNMTPEQATAAVQSKLTYPATGQVVFRDGDRVWVATPDQLGMSFNASLNVQRAYSVGRQAGLLSNLSSQMNAWQGGLDLFPVIVFDARTARSYLENIAKEIDQPFRETDLHLDGTQVVYTPGQIGRLLDVDATLSALIAQLSDFKNGEVPIVIDEQTPAVLDASAQAELLRQVFSSPLTIKIQDPLPGDPGPWTIDPTALAGLLTIQGVQTATGGVYQISANTEALDLYLGQIVPLVNQRAQNARFYFDDPSRKLVFVQAGVTGRSLDLPGSEQAIVQALLRGEHTVNLVLNVTQPEAGADATAKSLGITGLVSSYTSFFRGSPSARMQNIKAASKQFYGLLVPPNGTFSMADALGDVSLENGYEEALIIFNGRTITGVGGGVCQVSTTLYRTALYGGYPIVERHEHAYRVGYYEQTATSSDSQLAGLDATVYVPLVDLKFTNDRSSWLLMETYFDSGTQSLQWKFYSGDDGRVTKITNHGLQNVVPAQPPRIEENPAFSTGICKQVDYQADGADIWVTQEVSRGGTVLFTNNIYTHYEPWQAVFQYGPGTIDPQGLVAHGQCH